MKLVIALLLLGVAIGIKAPEIYAQSDEPTTFSVKISLHGIGNSGDSINPTNATLSNKDPDISRRDIFISVFTSANQPLTTKQGSITYNYDTLTYEGSIEMGPLQSGNYIVKMRTPSYLQKRVPGTIKVVKSTTVVIPAVTLTAGDINNDNKIDVLDYNVLRGCYSELLPPSFCDDKRLLASDLSNDGSVNLLDYNLFLREIGQKGD